MSTASLIISVIVAVIILVSAIFGASWKITQDIKKSAHARIERIETAFEICKDDKEKKATYEYVDDIFVRKDVHSIEYKHLCDEISKLSRKLQELSEKIS